MRLKTALTLSLLGLAALFASAPAGASSPFEGEKDGAYTIDGGHSSVLFKVNHLGISNFYGAFKDVSGALVIDNENPAKSSVQVMIRADSVDTRNEGRDKHVMSPDFFNVKQFPEMVFESTSVQRKGDGALEVTGEFTVHGETKELTFEASHVGHGDRGRSGYRTGYEATFTFKRSDFGMKYMLEGLGDEITIIASLEAAKD